MKSHIKLRDKIIFVILVITILGNFMFSKPVQASVFGDIAGIVMEEICRFVIFLRRYCFKYFTNNSLCRSRYNAFG